MQTPPAPTRRTACYRLLLVLVGAVFLVLWSPRMVSAHAHLVQADPAPDSVIAQVPTTGSFLFDEPLNPALTRIRVTDAAGKQVAGDGGYLAHGHGDELWQLPLPPLPDGTYSVYWTSESATDGHVMSSFYTFRVAANGSLGGLGTVSGTAAGSYGGSSGAGGLPLSGGGLATALFSWLDLCAQGLWLGALVIEFAVLSRARRAVETSQARLAWAATPRLWWLTRGAPVVAVWALAGEVLSLALQGTGGDWGRALASDTISGILNSQNGHFIVLRFAVLLLALLLAGRVQAPAAASSSRGRHAVLPPKGEVAPHRLGIIAVPLAAPRWESMRSILILLAVGYMVLVAFSGHAANVTPGWLALPIDWLHLVSTAAWAGGIAALAYGVLPVRHLIAPEERASAVLPLLDYFSPVAYSAIAALALSGLYNAVSHIDSPAVLGGTLYGQVLLIKLALIAILIALSASHVFGLRPRIVRAQRGGLRDAEAVARVHEGLATLAAQLRLESGVAAGVLLATALMGQVLPQSARVGAIALTQGAVPTHISGGATIGTLHGTLTVAPPAVGATTFTLTLSEGHTAVTADTGAAILHLSPLVQPALQANLTFVAHGSTFTATGGSLPASGTWRADVLVRTATVNDYRTLRYWFTVGADASFLAPGLDPARVTVTVAPGRLGVANTVTIGGLPATAVQILSQSLDMQMGALPYPATPLGQGRWRVSGVYAPMNGRWQLTVQSGGPPAGWRTVRQVIYRVPLTGVMQPVTP